MIFFIIEQIYESATTKRVEMSDVLPLSTFQYSYLAANNLQGLYDFSNKSAFQTKITPIEEKNAKEALRIVIDFLKTETENNEEDRKNMSYEPFLTKLIALKSEF